MRRLSRTLSLAATAGAAAAAWLGDDRLTRRTKPWIVPSLQLRVATRLGDDPTAPLLLAATTAATAGDCWLMQEHRLTGRQAERTFLRGVAAFAVQQIGYTVLLHRRGARLRWATTAPAALLLSGVGALAKRKEPRSWHVLTGYGALVLATALLAEDAGRREGRPGLTAGGGLFALSDALIVVRRMLIDDPTLDRLCDATVLVTYGAAQSLLLDGLEPVQQQVSAW